jgi:hypothetical protein
MKFGVGVLCKKLLNKLEVRGKRLGDRRTLLNGVPEFVVSVPY